MNLKLLFIVLILSWSSAAFAGNMETSLSFGPAIGFDQDFNSHNSKTAIHMDLGASVLFGLNCGKSFFCDDFRVGPSFHYLFSAQYNFGATQMNNSGVVGNFSEKAEYLLAALNFQKVFFSKNKFQPVAVLALGVSQTKLSGISYNDALENPLNISITRSSWQFFAEPSLGISYALSHRIKIGAAAAFFITIPGGLGAAGLRLPLSLAYAF